jgi:hypothetical protein
MWEMINVSKVMEIRSLNVDLDLMWKDLGVKLGEIKEDLRHFYFQNFKKNKMFCEGYELLKTLCRIWFFGQNSFIWVFLDL